MWPSPSVSRGNNRMQYLLLNGRHIRDRSLQHALSEAYRGLLLTGRFPVAFLRLEMPPEMVDVNVHPAKLEVRFADGRQLYSQLLGTLRNKFLTTDLTARAQLPRLPTSGTRSRARSREPERHRDDTMHWARGALRPRPARDGSARGSFPWGRRVPAVPEFRPFGPAETRRSATGRADGGRPAPSPARADRRTPGRRARSAKDCRSTTATW